MIDEVYFQNKIDCNAARDEEKKVLPKAHAEEKAKTGPSKSICTQTPPKSSDTHGKKTVGRLNRKV